MAATTTTGTQPLIAFTLPSSPEAAGIARCHVRAALDYHGLGDYADDAETITSELVTNAIEHIGLGATKLNEVNGATAHWVTLADPEGNQFDLIVG